MLKAELRLLLLSLKQIQILRGQPKSHPFSGFAGAHCDSSAVRLESPLTHANFTCCSERGICAVNRYESPVLLHCWRFGLHGTHHPFADAMCSKCYGETSSVLLVSLWLLMSPSHPFGSLSCPSPALPSQPFSCTGHLRG